MKESTSLRRAAKYYLLLFVSLFGAGWPLNNVALAEEQGKNSARFREIGEGVYEKEQVGKNGTVLDEERLAKEQRPKNKRNYLKIEPRVYNTDFSTEAYGGTVRLGTVIGGSKSTTIIEIGPLLLNYQSEEIRSIDAAIESYWDIGRGFEAYGRWYPSYVDGYGKFDFYNTVAAGVVIRLNGGIVDVNQFTGLASLTKGQYIKLEQDLSTFSNFQWSGNTSSARLGWAASGKKWTLAVEAGAAFTNDLFKGKRVRPSALFEYYYTINNDTSLNLSYFPNTDAGFDGPIRGQFGIALIRKF